MNTNDAAASKTPERTQAEKVRLLHRTYRRFPLAFQLDVAQRARSQGGAADLDAVLLIAQERELKWEKGF